MNLIEQLGGYEKAKVKEKELEYNLNNLEILGGGSARESMHERLNFIDQALLQYRRAHNIYEVGDDILYGVLGSEVVKYAEWMNNGTCIRHATDAEIEAGCRL